MKTRASGDAGVWPPARAAGFFVVSERLEMLLALTSVALLVGHVRHSMNRSSARDSARAAQAKRRQQEAQARAADATDAKATAKAGEAGDSKSGKKKKKSEANEQDAPLPEAPEAVDEEGEGVSNVGLVCLLLFALSVIFACPELFQRGSVGTEAVKKGPVGALMAAWKAGTRAHERARKAGLGQQIGDSTVAFLAKPEAFLATHTLVMLVGLFAAFVCTIGNCFGEFIREARAVRRVAAGLLAALPFGFFAVLRREAIWKVANVILEGGLLEMLIVPMRCLGLLAVSKRAPGAFVVPQLAALTVHITSSRHFWHLVTQARSGALPTPATWEPAALQEVLVPCLTLLCVVLVHMPRQPRVIHGPLLGVLMSAFFMERSVALLKETYPDLVGSGKLDDRLSLMVGLLYAGGVLCLVVASGPMAMLGGMLLFQTLFRLHSKELGFD